MTSLYENLRSLITVVDELRDVGLQKYISLPRIAAIGTQSSGKSSLIESIVGLDFLPRGGGVVTRRPLELRLVHLNTQEFSGNQAWAIFDGQEKKITDFNDVRKAKIVDQDVVVEVRGLPQGPPFRVGGKQGNIVTSSTLSRIHRGWCIVAVAGQRVPPQEVASALAAAQKGTRYTVTFRMGEDSSNNNNDPDGTPVNNNSHNNNSSNNNNNDPDGTPVNNNNYNNNSNNNNDHNPQLESTPEPQQLHEPPEGPTITATTPTTTTTAAAAATTPTPTPTPTTTTMQTPLQLIEEEGLREQLKAEMELKERLREKSRAEHQAAVQRLEKSTGLPPREQVDEPQRALMAVLTRPSKLPKARKKPQGPCDKCDGPHDAEDCPHFKKVRDDHKDAWAKYGSVAGQEAEGDLAGGEELVLRSARVFRQPGDGSCLFHSLAYAHNVHNNNSNNNNSNNNNNGLKSVDAVELRAEIADFIASHPETEVANNPIRDWVLWNSGLDPASYADSMRTGSRWGGAVEIAVCALVRQVCINVFEPSKESGEFLRISAFGDQSLCTTPLSLLYGGRVHYDALQPLSP
ncbi:unnamed protein product [Polarella glacialis]|uniref:Ubiquitin thioesterase OTU n=1 Tax=Polarella glacialis TaxID=89957 RepID=A0A813HPH0_POLGL|nr:unnamed protein product [Polarella glacialis]